MRMNLAATFIVITNLLQTGFAPNKIEVDQDFKTNLNYDWPKEFYWYCIAAIVADSKHIGTGVFIGKSTLLTSANVIESYKNQPWKVRVCTVDGDHTKTLCRQIGKISSVLGETFDRTEPQHWIRMGFDYFNSPVYDLCTMSVIPETADRITRYQNAKEGFTSDLLKRYVGWTYNVSDFYRRDYAHPFKIIVARRDLDIPKGSAFSYAGFHNYIKKEGKESNSPTLVKRTYELSHGLIVDCDEWLPRQWGPHLICLKNIHNDSGIESGTALFCNYVLLGVGSFTLEKNGESIHVFTDIRPYVDKMVIVTHEPGRVWGGYNYVLNFMDEEGKLDGSADYLYRYDFHITYPYDALGITKGKFPHLRVYLNLK